MPIMQEPVIQEIQTAVIREIQIRTVILVQMVQVTEPLILPKVETVQLTPETEIQMLLFQNPEYPTRIWLLHRLVVPQMILS